MNDTAKLQKLFFICKIFLYYFPITTRKFFHTMKGIDLKTEIKRQGKSITEVAEALGMSQQNLNSALSGDNIKTGTLERVAEFLGKPISFFYNEGNVATVGGDGTANAGSSINDSMLIDEIAAQRRLTEQALSQNGQLLNIIENLTKK